MRRFVFLMLFSLLSIFIGCSCDDPADPVIAVGTIQVRTLPEGIGGTWVLTGPDNYARQSAVDTTLTRRNVGRYTISWQELSYMIDPLQQVLDLTANDTIVFIGTYQPDPAAAGMLLIDTTPDYIQAGWTLSGPDDFVLPGIGDATVADALPGDYTLVWDEVDTWVTPDDIAVNLPGLGIKTLAGTYALKPENAYTLVINASPDELAAPWVLKVDAGDGYFDLQGTGDRTLAGLPLVAQTLEWLDVPDWLTPSPDVTQINPASEDVLVLDGTYVPRAELALNLVSVPAGTFNMGSPQAELGHQGDEYPVHEVTLTRPLLASDTEITQAQWEAVMGANPSISQAGANYPVESISWLDALAFCNALSTAESLTPAYAISGFNTVWNPDADGYRLPTEAEWEYLCRAGTETALPLGDLEVEDCSNDTKLSTLGWYCYNAVGIRPVACKQPNDLGLYDMYGNVMEWCWDAYGEAWYLSSPAIDPTGPSTVARRVVRGGSFGSLAKGCRSAARAAQDYDTETSRIGLRIVRNN